MRVIRDTEPIRGQIVEYHSADFPKLWERAEVVSGLTPAGWIHIVLLQSGRPVLTKPNRLREPV